MIVEHARISLNRRQLVLVTVGVLVSMMLPALDTSIVATAMPWIIADLAGLEYYAWVTTAYLVTSTTIVPISGKLGDLFGRKRFLLGGMLGFLFTSVLCGFAQSMPQLVVTRALQGVFGGFLISSALASTADLYVPATRAKIQGVFASGFALAATTGPILGGILTDQLGWRYVFFVDVPIGVLAFVLVAATMPTVPTHATWRQIDVRGAALLTAVLVPLLVALTATGQGQDLSLVVALLIVAAVMLGAFAWVETRAAHPVMPLVLFRVPTFAVAVVVSFLSAFGMFGPNIFIPLVYQGLLGMSATESGVLLTPRIIAMVAGSLVSGQIVTRIERYRFVSASGLASLAIGLFMLSRVDSTTSESEVIRDLVLIGMGYGIIQPIYLNAVISAVPYKYVGVASSQVQFWRSLGQTVGVTLFGAILALAVGPYAKQMGDVTVSSGAPPAALAAGLQRLFLVASLAVAVAVVVAVGLREVPFRARRVSVESAGALATTSNTAGD